MVEVAEKKSGEITKELGVLQDNVKRIEAMVKKTIIKLEPISSKRSTPVNACTEKIIASEDLASSVAATIRQCNYDLNVIGDDILALIDRIDL